ncbi:hypothetical protein P8452_07450 [Trifolium repens]|nr:hypothetical protein P8452_07450 [Trifolium repens]
MLLCKICHPSSKLIISSSSNVALSVEPEWDAEWNRRLAGAKIDPTFVIDTLDFYLKFYKWTKKEEEMNHRLPSKKINLVSSNKVMLEVDYGVTVELMSHRFEDIEETISDCKVNTKMLILIIEYYKVHKHNSGMMPFEVMDSNAQLVDVDLKTLFDLATSACYMKIDSLEKLTWSNCVVLGYF